MRLLQDWVTEQAGRRPDAVALVMSGTGMTYRALEDAGNRLAHLLREAGCRAGDRVCLLLPKSIEAIVAIHGVLKAGCIYVPMDTGSPALRAAKIVTACEPRVILAAAATVKLLGEIRDACPAAREARIGLMQDALPHDGLPNGADAAFTLADAAVFPSSAPEVQRSGEDIAHILFTSGSTGTPKGVVIRHSSVLAFVDWARQYFGISASDRTSGHPPLHFDLSTFDIFGTFSAGAQLHLVPPELNLLPNKVAEFIRTSELTQWFSVPSLLNFMAKMDVVRFGDFPHLKRLLWCGETFPTPPLIYWMKRLPHVQFTNLYGPTEATIASSHYTVPACPADENTQIPIGTACTDEELLVLDAALKPVAPGEIGDLYIKGAGLSPGYWRDPEKTREVFQRNPFGDDADAVIYKTGDLARIDAARLIYFCGRADSQIKSRGYRIELGEIETALNAMPDLKECAVVAVDAGAFEGATICCALVPAEGAGVTAGAVRKALSRRLPSYMLPARWALLEALPKNANGKIDRRRLREEFAAGRI